MLLVERHYLHTYGGSFTENFYGLKRERVLRVKGGEIPRTQIGAAGQVRETLKLRESDVWRNLAIMVGLPYIKRKLDESYDIHAANQSVLGPAFQRDIPPPSNAKLKERFMYYYKWFLRKVYPSVNAAYYFSLLAFNLAYLFDSSKYHSPFMWLVGTRIRRMGDVDYKAIELASQPRVAQALRPGQAASIFNPRVFARTVGPRLLSSLRILLPTSIFALKFLEWWHASDFARQLSRKAAEGLELPPPVTSGLPRSSYARADAEKAPVRDDRAAVQAVAARPISSTTLLPILTVPPSSSADSALCPICGKDIVNATTAPSGFVYCYSCIHKWVEGNHERQIAFMEGGDGEEGWGEEDSGSRSREGRWESGKGRDAVTGRRILAGTEMLRRVVV